MCASDVAGNRRTSSGHCSPPRTVAFNSSAGDSIQNACRAGNQFKMRVDDAAGG